MVRLLATYLGNHLRQRPERRVRERNQSHRVRGVVQVAPDDAEGPVGARMVQQPAVAVAVDRAAEGGVVGILSRELRAQAVEDAGMADLVLGERAEGHVLLQHGRDARPLRVKEALDELVVGERQQQLGEGFADIGRQALHVEPRHVPGDHDARGAPARVRRSRTCPPSAARRRACPASRSRRAS